MPLTNIEIIRQHLSSAGVGRETFRDVALQLSGAAPVAIGYSNLKSGSVLVKGKEIGTPRFESVTLESDPVALAQSQLIPDSVVVASDTSLGRIYTENIDYTIDYPAGRISRVAAGAIESGATVAVWYYRYQIYTESTDYAISLTQGTIRRIAGGAIEDGQVVYLDYQTLAGFFSDAQVAQAIGEADDRLRLIVSQETVSETNQTLIVAETYIAVALLCRMKAVSSLEPDQTGSNSRAADWLQLADRYERDGLALASRFAQTRPSLSSPAIVKGGGES